MGDCILCKKGALRMRKLCRAIGMLCTWLVLAQTVAFCAVKLSSEEMGAVFGGCGYCKGGNFCNAKPCSYPSSCPTCTASVRHSHCNGPVPDPKCTPQIEKEGCGQRLVGCTCLQVSGDKGMCHDGTSCDKIEEDWCDRDYCDNPYP